MAFRAAILTKKFGALSVVAFGGTVLYNPTQSEVGLHNQHVAKSFYPALSTNNINNKSTIDEAEAKAGYDDCLLSVSDMEKSNISVNSACSSSSASSSDSLSTSLFQNLALARSHIKNPITEDEANSAIEVLIQVPGALESLFANIPQHAHRDLNKIFGDVRNVVTNLDLVDKMVLKIEEKESRKALMATEENSTSHFQLSAWDELSMPTAFGCGICLDVCAVPHVLTCGHTFCWDCLNQLRTKCISEDSSIEVLHNCPECRREISDDLRYERKYDECICKAVENIPNCDEKDAWNEKRRRYEQREREIVESDDESDEKNNDELSESWDPIVVALLAFTIISLVIAMRSKR